MTTKATKAVDKPVETVENNEEVQSVQTEQPKEKEAEKPESPLAKMLRDMRERNAELAQKIKARPKIECQDPALMAKFNIPDLNADDQLQVMAEIVVAVKKIVDTDKSVSYDTIIQKGDECPCAKHTAAKTAAIMLKHNWIGVA